MEDDYFNTLKLALFNVRSLARKQCLINDFVLTHKLDFMFLTETWLNQDNHITVLKEKKTAPNYSLMSKLRQNKKGGGGEAVLFNYSLQCVQMFHDIYASFEYVRFQWKSLSLVLFLNVCYEV